jgi:plasmid stabilization system protein ParE
MEEVSLRMVEAAAADAPGAWQRLWASIEPGLWALVDRPRFASHRAHTEDARRRIVTAIRTQLAMDRCHQLQRFLDSRRLHPHLGFERWLRAFAKRIGARHTFDTAEPVRRRLTLAK